MISVLTPTYKRKHLLEEAIFSYLQQTYDGPSEMVIINDAPEAKYMFDHPDVRIINCPERFSSVGKKLEWGFKQCKYKHIYRLDDDDLLTAEALELIVKDIQDNPGYDIYRSKAHYFFSDNIYQRAVDNINNGNVYSKVYTESIPFPEKSGDEDVIITYGSGARIFNAPREKYTMIYRWGMNTYHISGMGLKPTEEILKHTDSLVKNEQGTIELFPHFDHDYYTQIK